MKRICLALGFAALLPGCDVVSAVKLATAEHNLRQECFARYTNDCVSKTIDFNIMVVEEIKSGLLKQEDLWSEAFGDSRAGDMWVDHIENISEEAYEALEESRPGFFYRVFMGEAQPFSGRNVLPLNLSDIKELSESAAVGFVPIASKAGFVLTDEARQKYGIAPDPIGKPETNSAPEVNLVAVSEPDTDALTQAIDRHVDAETSRDGGMEYMDARIVLLTDLNGDSYTDAAVLYSIEGQGGGNGSFQTLAAFYAANDGGGAWSYQGSTVVYGAGTGIKSTEYRKISITSLVHGPDDARCCPSIEGLDTYTWNGERFVAPESTNISF